MNDFVIQDGLLTKYDGDGADVAITDSVTSIGAFAFAGCTGLESVTLSRNLVIRTDF